MTWTAAGRTGGRPAAQRPGRVPARRGGVRALLAGLLAAPLVAAPLVVLPPPAAAAPGDAPVGEDDTSDPARPVQIDVSRFEPRTLAPDSTVTISGTLTNNGTETLTDLDVRLQRGEVLATRDDLLAVESDPDPMTAVVQPFREVPGELEPGDSMTFVYTTTGAELRIDRDGVFPVLLNLNGSTPDGERRRVGELSTYLMQQPVTTPGSVSVAWLWPLVERTHRDAAGRFVDDGLAEEVDAGGRLDRALAVVERLPETTPPEGGEPAPAVPVTLAIDPALVEELTLMAEGPYDVAGEEGAGTEEAAAFLERLRAVAADHPVVALPYGDVDADALAAAGLSAAVTRSLPGSPEGTARDGRDDASGEAAAPTGGEGDPAGEEPQSEPGRAGEQILRDALGVPPRTDLGWAVGGSVHVETLTTLQAGGIEEVVLPSSALSDGGRALGLGDAAATARTSIPTAGGGIDALVADSGLGVLVASAEQADGGVRIAEQRYLAELLLLGLRPGGESAAQSVLIAPSREVDADPEGVSAMIAATAQQSWLRPASVADLGSAAPAGAGQLLDPADGVALDAAGLADVVAAVGERDDLAGAVVGDPEVALAPYDAAVSRATSAAWRDDPGAFRAAAADLRSTLTGLRDRVTLLAPVDGTYSLASSESPLVLTVRNDLPFAVRVLLDVRTRGKVGLTIADIGPQVLAPGQRTTLQVPTEVRQSGRFAVAATLSTPGGGPLGDRVQLQVQSTAYGAISLIITFGAAALLALLFLRRLVLFLVHRRRGPAEEELPTASAEGAAPSLPPTRSPV
ncbi:MAG TPA: DUF6049 family protein [Geodermatophilus sp.]|nr:DUF6049 family protein [Geodermatophilus sp.]